MIEASVSLFEPILSSKRGPTHHLLRSDVWVGTLHESNLV